MDILIRRRVRADIPVLELLDAAGERRPLVLLYHGYLNRKDFMLNQAYFLASQGFAVAVPDAWGHGERAGEGFPDFFTSVLRTADEIDALIELYREEPLVDAQRVGLTGYSMGGCIAYEYCARPGRRVQAAVPFIATPDWAALMSAPGTGQEFLKTGLIHSIEDMAQLVALAQAVQPLNRKEHMANLPLLMLNGAMDPLMPVDSLQRFYEAVKPLYSRQEDISLCVYPGVGHADNVEMNLQMAAWFAKYL